MTEEVQALAEVDSAPEQVVTAEPVAEEVVSTPEDKPVEAPKTFTQEELDAAIGKRLAREQRKWEREQAAKFAETQAKQAPKEVPPADQFESPEAYVKMTAAEYLKFFAGFYAVENIPHRIEELASTFELESLSKRVGKMSQGNRRKVQLMRSLLHRPQLVLWDEPTEHLDPRAQRIALACLRESVSMGATALITSHRLEQMQEFADDFSFLRQGSIVHSLSRETLESSVDEVEIEGVGPLDDSIKTVLTQRFSSLELLSARNLTTGEWGIRLRSANLATSIPDVVQTLVQGGARILRVEPQGHSLETLYQHHVEISP